MNILTTIISKKHWKQEEYKGSWYLSWDFIPKEKYYWFCLFGIEISIWFN